jgi:mono/diheme cytochrome c family protein
MAQYIAQFGIIFLILGFAATFLMFHLWGYPYDKNRRKSEAPRWAMWMHRILGYMFAAVYVAIMWHMVPRLWEYQVEFPARTTAHIILGFTVGFLLIIKIAIMRFFRHFEEWMPFLGTGILLCSVLLLGLSIPFVFQERALAASAPGGHAYSAESQARVAELLPTAKLPPEANVASLSTEKALRRGRQVLLGKCVKCHDLKTILAKPRTPSGWWSTVERMADKPALFAPLTEEEMWVSTAYLVAITPDLQKSVKRARQDRMEREESVEAAGEEMGDGDPSDAGVESPPPMIADAAPAPVPLPVPVPVAVAPTPVPKPKPTVDIKKAQATYESVCSQCHDLSDVDDSPPKSRKGAEALIRRMIEENEMEATKSEITLVRAWLVHHFVEGKD